MNAVKNLPSWEILGALGAITAVVKLLGLDNVVGAVQVRLLLLFSALIFAAAIPLHLMPPDMPITGADQARQTAVFGPLLLLIIGYFGITMNIGWLALSQSDAKQAS